MNESDKEDILQIINSRIRGLHDCISYKSYSSDIVEFDNVLIQYLQLKIDILESTFDDINIIEALKNSE